MPPRRNQPEPPIIGYVALFMALVVLYWIYTVVRDFYESSPIRAVIVAVIIVGFVSLAAFVVRAHRKKDAELRRQRDAENRQRWEEEQLKRRKQRQEEQRQRQEEQRKVREQQEEERKREEQERAEQIEAMLERDAFRESVHYMEGVEFENFMANVFDKKGYHVQTTPTTGDQGVDLLLTIDGHKVAVQLKRYTAPVGNKAVADVVAGMFHYKAREAWVITTSSFTKSAVELAKSNRVRLVDGRELEDWLDDLRDEA